MPGDEGEASISGRLEYPNLDPKGGPGLQISPSFFNKGVPRRSSSPSREISNKRPLSLGPIGCFSYHIVPSSGMYNFLPQGYGDGPQVPSDPVRERLDECL